MSYWALYQQLSIEFVSDAEFKHCRAREDAFDLCVCWRQTYGRHVAEESLSDEFTIWWVKHYAEILQSMGHRRSYRRFMDEFLGKLPLRYNWQIRP